MTTLFLLNSTQVGSAAIQLAGFSYDSVNDAALIANIQAAGGLLSTGTVPILAASAAAIQQHRQGATKELLDSIMLVAAFGTPVLPLGTALGDANSNIDFTLSKRVILPSVPLTAARTYTLLSAANSAQGSNALFPLFIGARREITRLDVAAFTAIFNNGGPGAGTLATLAVSKTGYVLVEWDGTNWQLVNANPT